MFNSWFGGSANGTSEGDASAPPMSTMGSAGTSIVPAGFDIPGQQAAGMGGFPFKVCADMQINVLCIDVVNYYFVYLSVFTNGCSSGSHKRHVSPSHLCDGFSKELVTNIRIPCKCDIDIRGMRN